MSNDDEIKRVYVQLASLRENLPDEHPDVTVKWEEINLYNVLLDRLEQLGFEIEEYRLPESMLGNETTLSNYLTGEHTETGNSRVRLGVLKTKLDALLMYFSVSNKKV